MTGRGRLMALVGLCAAVAGAWAQDEPPAWPERKLEFETVDEPLAGRTAQIPYAGKRILFAASFGIPDAAAANDSSELLNRIGRSSLHATPSGQKLSREQQVWLGQFGLTHRIYRYSANSPGLALDKPYYQYLRAMQMGTVCVVFGASDEDARLMALALIEAADQNARQELELAKTRLDKAQQDVREAKAELPKLTAAAQQFRESLKQYTERTGYGSNESAQADMAELKRMLRSIDVEITGIRAKVDAIQQHKSQATGQDAGVQVALDRMLVEEDVNLAGALARRKAVEDHLTEGRIYCDQLYVANSYDKRIGECNTKLTNGEATVAELEKKLADPPPNMRPLEVYANKIIIQPVK